MFFVLSQQYAEQDICQRQSAPRNSQPADELGNLRICEPVPERESEWKHEQD